ncbi:MAG: hypothetical protein M1817_003232 [Caeruleum heppii]|nr:MAG: hypothetical protein M1817_003232 [Caeruleum heppii]
MDPDALFHDPPPEPLPAVGTESPNQAVAPATASSQTSRQLPIRKSKPSCNLCRKRKIKCDRTVPCAHCRRSGAVCVSSAPSRLPRGRQGGRRKADRELLDRIARLEKLVKGIEGEETAEDGSTPQSSGAADTQHSPSAELGAPVSKVQSHKSGSKPSKEGLDRYLGSSVWMSLSDEIHGMREVLNESSDDEDEGSDLTPNSPSPSLAQAGHSSFVICRPDLLPDVAGPLKHPTRSQVHSLYACYLTNVDPVVKMLHGPSLRRYLVEETGQLDCSPGPRGWEALRFAIYYTATSSLTPEECSQMLGEEQLVLLPYFRLATELALARADFVNTDDMSTLQALILYLFAVRSIENSRRTWTMTSLAVRIAHALGLHRERRGGNYTWPHPPFEREMRRRLWWQICILDMQASIDRGSDPIIISNSFSTQLPLHVNDTDLSPGASHEVQSRDDYTDTTIALMCHEVFEVERRLNYVPAGESYSSQQQMADPGAERRNWVIACRRRMEDRFLRHCDMTIPVQRYTRLVADIMTARMLFCVYRPLQRHSDSPNTVIIPYPGILHLTVEVMEKAIQIPLDPSARPFRWFSSIWVQWHALAVMIAELCVQTEGPTVERAWALAEVVYEESGRHVADSEKGRLWRPIKKLMNQARAVRKTHLKNAGSRRASLPTDEAQQPATRTVPQSGSRPAPLSGVETGAGSWRVGDGSGWVPPTQPSAIDLDPMPIDWDPWLAAGPVDSLNYADGLNERAWTNWENFVEDFQAHGDFLPGQEGATAPPFDLF